MFQVGDLIMYANTGVCRVEDIYTAKTAQRAETMLNLAKTEEQLYYKLVPVYSREVIYIPVDAKVFMRPIISREEANELIANIPNIEEEIFDCRNLKSLSDHYQSFLQTHRCEDLIHLIKSVWRKNQDMIRRGKRLGQTDQRYMKRAEELLYDEFASALDIPRDSVQDYIRQAIEEKGA